MADVLDEIAVKIASTNAQRVFALEFSPPTRDVSVVRSVRTAIVAVSGHVQQRV